MAEKGLGQGSAERHLSQANDALSYSAPIAHAQALIGIGKVLVEIRDLMASKIEPAPYVYRSWEDEGNGKG